MRNHPGLPPEFSGGRDFWSDANLDQRATPADATDFALMPGESQSDALANSAALRAVQASGGQLPVLRLAEVEVDEGFRSADLASDYLSPTVAPLPTTAPPMGLSDSAVDRLVDLLADRLTKRLGGN